MNQGARDQPPALPLRAPTPGHRALFHPDCDRRLRDRTESADPGCRV